MSHLNGSAHPGVLDKLVRPAKGSGYRPHVWVGSRMGQLLDGRPRFTWLEAERMRFDPQIQFGLRILRAPLFGVTWKVNSDSEQVGRWVDRETTRVYRAVLPKFLRHFEYGVACGEVTFQARRLPGGKTRVHFHDMGEFHPRDCRPLVYNRGKHGGRLAGMRVSNIQESGAGSILLDRRHSCWFKGDAEYGDWWGRPRLAGAYEPWLEKRGRHGAIDSRRLFYKKGAFRGPTMRHPPGVTDLGTEDAPRLVSNQDVAREIVEKFENGGVMALPGTRDQEGNFLWEWEDPKSFSDVAGLLDYPKQLDREILIGLGIPPELVDAATVGSGYSGRAIPAQVFFCSMDEVAGLILACIVEQIIRPLVRINFGRVGFEVVPDSLAQLVARDPAQAGQQGGAGGQPQPAAGGGGTVPYQGKKGGIGQLNPSTGKVTYGTPKPKVRLSLTARKEKRAARRARLRLSWTKYQGPKGGAGWVSDTGEVRYQEHQPVDEPTRGPESVFDHPDFAHVPGPDQTPDYEAIRAKYHAKAEAAGLDPAELHRDAADALHHRMNSAVQYSSFGKPEDQAHRAKIASLGHVSAADLAELKKQVEYHHKHYEIAKDAPGVNHAAWKESLASWDKKLADAQASFDKGESLRKESEEWRSGSRKVPRADRARLVAESYATAHENLARTKADREAAAAFTDQYFAQDNPLRRVAAYLKALKADNGLDVSHLDADTREKITEDLARLPPAKLAAHLAWAADQMGTEDNPVWDMARQAAAGAKASKPVRFDGSKAEDYSVVTEDDVNSDQWAGLLAAAKILPGADVLANGAIVIKAGSPLAKIHDEQHGGIGEPLDNDGGLQPLFERLKDSHHLPQADVPASAKDFGTTSGALAPDKVADEDWNPNAVDVYKRLDKGGEWFLMKRGEHRAEAGGDAGTYAVVHKKDVPPLSRLPDVYWESLTTDAGNADDDLVERAEKREHKASAAGVAEKKGIKEHRAAIDAHRKTIGRLRQEWHKALKGVPEQERPDEPDWNDVDDSPLTDSFESREDHAAAMSDLAADYEYHASNMADEVEAAKSHKAEWEKNNATHREAIEGHRKAWRAADVSHKEALAYHAKTRELADADQEIADESLDQILSHEVPEMAEGANPDAVEAMKGVQDAFNDIDDVREPDHDDGSSVDESEYEEKYELPDDGYDSLEDQADSFAAAAGEHNERLDEVRAAAKEHRETVTKRSAEWRADVKDRLTKLRAKIQSALAIPADRYTDSEGPGQQIHDSLTELNKSVVAALARVSKKVSLSLGGGADARRLWLASAAPIQADSAEVL